MELKELEELLKYYPDEFEFEMYNFYEEMECKKS